MPDSLRDSNTADSSAASRDSQIEELLLTGLDHYFNGQHELAISVWTRVLFLDRTHPRARAYIERARSAIAERQREAEELLQTGVAAFQRGDAANARRLLSSAVERGARPEEPLALLERLARLSPADAVPVSGTARAQIHTESPGRPPRPRQDAAAPRRGRAIGFVLVLVVGVVAGALLVLYATTGGLTWPAATPVPVTTAAPTAPDPLPMPSPGDIALVRAHASVSAGRLTDALRILDEIPPGDALRGQADQMRTDIQQRLLAAAHAVVRAGTADR